MYMKCYNFSFKMINVIRQHLVTSKGIEANPDKVEALISMEKPKDSKEGLTAH